MTRHVMLDLETLSSQKNAAIIQLAAVSFDAQTGAVYSEFNRFTNDIFGHVAADTVAWWMQQDFAPQLGKLLQTSGVPTAQALADFCGWCSSQTIEAIWSHGATFDLPVVGSALAAAGLKTPWRYSAERDTRTLYALAPGGMPAVRSVAGTKHDALYDCHVQVKQVVGALAALRSGLAK